MNRICFDKFFLTTILFVVNVSISWGQTNITSLSAITDPTAHYILTSDVSGSGHTSIASFSGTLEAAINPDTKMPYRITDLDAPLFSTLTGTVKNLVLEDVEYLLTALSPIAQVPDLLSADEAQGGLKRVGGYPALIIIHHLRPSGNVRHTDQNYCCNKPPHISKIASADHLPVHLHVLSLHVFNIVGMEVRHLGLDVKVLESKMAEPILVVFASHIKEGVCLHADVPHGYMGCVRHGRSGTPLHISKLRPGMDEKEIVGTAVHILDCDVLVMLWCVSAHLQVKQDDSPLHLAPAQ